MEKYSTYHPGGQRAGERRCLMCRRTFGSEGPHNRVCDRCKQSRAWREGALDDMAVKRTARR